ncbi:MAG: CRISPR-associated endoribonuclease Cas6 [Candidatus Micrarchaeia archaeon]
MRLLLKLKAAKNASYDMTYYHKAQGLIYDLLRDTPYSILHDKRGYKFFCFSNIFPIGDFKERDVRNFLISSPDSVLIKMLKERIEERKTINIGELSFIVEECKLLKIKIQNNLHLISATPIILRIPRRNYSKYNIESDKPYVFWQPSYSFEVFVKQLEENIFKKYNEFYKSKVKEFPLFEQFVFKKSTVNHVVVDGKEQKFFGSVWEFKFYGLKYNAGRRKVLEFAIDCGVGERNTFGFGFVNVIKDVKRNVFIC